MTVLRCSKSGEITVFLSLIMSVVLGLVSVIFESARSQSIKFQDEIAMDSALRSCFGEYHRELFNKYHLLYIDSSYRVGVADNENISEHMSSYMKNNLDFDDGSSNLFFIDVSDSDIKEYLLASDNGGFPMYCQAINYQENYADCSHVEMITGIRNEICKKEDSSILSAWDSSLQRVRSFGVSFINPSEIVRGMVSAADSQLIEVRSGKLTGYSSNVPSKRELRMGNYEGFIGNENELLFAEYLYQNCGSFIHPKIDSTSSCELEYLCYGNSKDKRNLENVINRLIRIFSNHNMSVVTGKEDELMAFAEAIVPPPVDIADIERWFNRELLVEAVADSLKYAWAYTEAILKVDRLLGGGRVNAANPSSEWIIPLTEIASYRSMMGGNGGSGYCYEEFLSVFIKDVGREVLCQRLFDIIETNMISLESPGFMIDGCVEYMNVRIDTTSSFGYEYNITRDYAYESKYRKNYGQ